jgi:hypothetical protein
MRGRTLGVMICALGFLSPVTPMVEAGCAGPMLSVTPAEFSPVPPDSSDDAAEPFYTVRAGQRVTVTADNLGPCPSDVVTGGCTSRAEPEPVMSPARIPGVDLSLEQGSQRWRLGSADATAPEYEISYQVELPDDLREGRATLRLTGAYESGTYVRLVVR